MRMLDIWNALKSEDSKITLDIFAKGIQSLDIGMKKKQLEVLFEFLDESKDGILEYGELRKMLVQGKKNRSQQLEEEESENLHDFNFAGLTSRSRLDFFPH